MRAQMKTRRLNQERGLHDLIAKHLDVLFCGINPAMSAAKSGHHFSNRSNRFWKVLHMAGFTPEVIHPANSGIRMRPDRREGLIGNTAKQQRLRGKQFVDF
jgi:G:T/U-mismatch repair DNA glycosylase